MFPNFDGLKYFKPKGTSDEWGDPSKIDRNVLLKVEELRKLLRSPIFVTSGYRNPDPGSQHELGKALDLVCPGVSLYVLYQAAERIGFQGLGVYPAWKYGGKVVGGIHVDVRDSKQPARWMGVPGVTSKQEYIALNQMNLKKYGVIT